MYHLAHGLSIIDHWSQKQFPISQFMPTAQWTFHFRYLACLASPNSFQSLLFEWNHKIWKSNTSCSCSNIKVWVVSNSLVRSYYFEIQIYPNRKSDSLSGSCSKTHPKKTGYAVRSFDLGWRLKTWKKWRSKVLYAF